MEDIIDETSFSRSRSNPSSEIVPYGQQYEIFSFRIPAQNGDEGSEHAIPWYWKLFHWKKRNSSVTTSDDEQEDNHVNENDDIQCPTVVEVKNLHKTYLLGLGM